MAYHPRCETIKAMSATIAAMTVRTMATTPTTTLVSSPDAALRLSAERQMPAASWIPSRTSLMEGAGAGGLGGEVGICGRTMGPAIDAPQLAQTAAVMLLATLQVRHLRFRAEGVGGAPVGRTTWAGAGACGLVGRRLVGGDVAGAAGELAAGGAALGGISCRIASRSGTFSKGRAQYPSRRSASLTTA